MKPDKPLYRRTPLLWCVQLPWLYKNFNYFNDTIKIPYKVKFTSVRLIPFTSIIFLTFQPSDLSSKDGSYLDSLFQDTCSQLPAGIDLELPHQKHIIANLNTIAEFVAFDDVISIMYTEGILGYHSKQMADEMHVGEVNKSRRLLTDMARMGEAEFVKVARVLGRKGHPHLEQLLLGKLSPESYAMVK